MRFRDVGDVPEQLLALRLIMKPSWHTLNIRFFNTPISVAIKPSRLASFAHMASAFICIGY